MRSSQKGSVFQEEIMKKFEEMSELRSKIQRDRIEMALRIREILSPEQIQKFMQFKEQRKRNRKGHRKGNRRGKRRNPNSQINQQVPFAPLDAELAE